LYSLEGTVYTAGYVNGASQPVLQGSWWLLGTNNVLPFPGDSKIHGVRPESQTDKDLGVLQFGNNSLCRGGMVHLSGKKDISEQSHSMQMAFSVIPSNMGIDQIPNWNSLGGEEREVGKKQKKTKKTWMHTFCRK